MNWNPFWWNWTRNKIVEPTESSQSDSSQTNEKNEHTFNAEQILFNLNNELLPKPCRMIS